MTPTISLMPHAVCWAAAPRLIWTMVITNAITALSYLTICCTLFYLARRTRRVIAGDWVYFLIGFALFIVACGSTHALEVVTTWIPFFWFDAWTNIVTALLSAYVAVMLIRRAATIAFGVNDYSDRLGSAEREKLQLQESLIAAQKLEDWSRMSAVISHEIRNPLESIANVLYLIRNSNDLSPEIAELVQMAQQESTRVQQIAESTLSFFREAPQPEPTNLSDAVNSVAFLLTPLFQERSVALRVHASGDTIVEAFPGETRQVLLNLVRNACEAITQPGAQVDVSLAGSASGVEVVIADQGVGIDPLILPTLFQFGVSTKGRDGNGIGLWTVKHILLRHGGRVNVDSRPGQGTRFTLFWPRTCSSRPAPLALSRS